MAELRLENVSKRFGGLLAVNNLDLKVPQGKILSLIGPNGAGKTTVFNMITGVYPPTEGNISYGDNPLNGLRSNRIIAQGIARTFQNIRLFKSMTVLENVQVGMHCRTQSGPVRALMSWPQLLLLDEPSLGLAPKLVEKIFETIIEINKSGVTIFLVEQNAHMALTISNTGFVMETGRIVLTDQASALLENEQVKKAYLGE